MPIRPAYDADDPKTGMTIDEMRRFIEMAEAAGAPGTAVIEVSTVGLLHPRIRTAKVHDARK